MTIMTQQLLVSISFLLFTSNIFSQTGTPVSQIYLEESNVSGGGFQSDITITDDGLTVYSSADVSGIFKSVDGGLSYENINEGLKSPKVASLAITPDNEQILYSGTGDKGGSGGLFRSIDAGDYWEITGDGNNAQFAGNHSSSNDPVPLSHPRSNGDLIVVVPGSIQSDYIDDIVIAGTYKNGVKIFTKGGDIEASTVNGSGFVRSVAYDASIPNIAYAAMYFANDAQNGIYEIDFSNPHAATSTLVYQTPLPEGLAVLSSGHVYAAVGENGIIKYNGNTWSPVNTGLDTGNNLRQWTAVTGYVKNSTDIVYVGLNNLGGNASGTNYSSIWRSVNGGTSWTSLVNANTNVSDQILGQSYDWWYRTNGFQQGGLGRTNAVVSSIDVALGVSPQSVTDDIIYVSGRGGIWKSDDGGATWNPAVHNMQATANNGVAVNPNYSTQVVLANTDYVMLETSNHFLFDNISRDKPNGSDSKAYDVIFDSTADDVIIATGDRDANNAGEVFVKSVSTIGNPSNNGWTSTNLNATIDKRAKAVTYGYHDGTSPTSRIILAAVENEEVFRYQNGSWSATGLTIGASKRSNFVWPDNGNSGVVYLLDLKEGLFRSNDGGQSWTNIWPSMTFNNNDFFNAGYITADDNDPTTLYLSIQGRSGSPIGTNFKVYRMTGADTGIFGAPGTAGITDISLHSGSTKIERPGPIVFGLDGNLWLTQQQNSTNSIYAGLYVMENPTSDASFKDLTTNEYRNIAINPTRIDVSSDRHVYVSQGGTGVVKMFYDFALPVELYFFEVLQDDCTVSINWEVISENKIDYYEIERSSNDGLNFESIQLVAPIESMNYFWKDESVNTGRYFYRLKMWDMNGTFEYSDVESVMVNCGERKDNKIHIFPNPIIPEISSSVTIELNFPGTSQLYIVDMFGDQLVTIPLVLEDGWISLNIPIHQFSAGIYFINIESETEIIKSKAFVVK